MYELRKGAAGRREILHVLRYAARCGSRARTERLSCDTLYPGGAYTETPAYQHDRERMRASELASAPYSGFDFTNYVRLENGAMVGFVFGHTAANRAAEDYYNNLYLLTQDGHAVFLNAGGRRCTGLFVQDNEVHWTENGQTRSVPLPL